MAIQLNGKGYTTKTFNALVSNREKNADKADALTTDSVKLAILQLAHHNNADWMKRLFAAESLRLKSGGLNKDGRALWSYVTAYYKGTDWSDEQGCPVIAKTLSKGSDGIEVYKTAGAAKLQFVLTDEKDDKGRPVKVSAISEEGFPLPSFREWRNRKPEAKSDEGTAKPLNTKATAKRFNELAKELVDGREVTASMDDYAALKDAIRALDEALTAAKPADKGPDVDADRVHMSNGMKPSASAKKAG